MADELPAAAPGRRPADCPTRAVLLVLEYDGTDFHGFQWQEGRRTVQGELEAAWRQITGEQVRVSGAGRTDAGVHAAGQVASLRTASALPTARLVRALNAVLAPDLAVTAGRDAPPDFHARYSARGRVYRYSIWNALTPTPLRRRYVLHWRHPLDVAAMQQAASLLVGTHDFASFAGAGAGTSAGAGASRGSGASEERTTLRTVFRAECRRAGEPEELVEIELAANAFLPHMVRNVVGTLLWVGSGRTDLPGFAAILAARDRTVAGPTAPARGLCLTRVIYDGDLGW